MKRYILVIAVMLVSMIVKAQSMQSLSSVLTERGRLAYVTDSLSECLESAKFPQDSVAILFDLIDVHGQYGIYNEVDPKVQESISSLAEQLYWASAHAGDMTSQFEALRLLTLSNKGKLAVQKEIYQRLQSMPECRERQLTGIFIRLHCIMSEINYSSDEENQQNFINMCRNYTNQKSLNDEESLEILYAMIVYLEKFTTGDLLSMYIDELMNLVSSLDLKIDELMLQFYRRASLAYTGNGDYAKSIDADRKLLLLIDRMEKERILAGREFADFDWLRYVSLRRLLSNYRMLQQREIEEYYNKVVELASIDPYVAIDFDRNTRAKVYFLMSQKRYAEAIPLLKYYLETSNDEQYSRMLMRELMDAAEAVGDQRTLGHTAIEYSRVLEDLLAKKSVNAYQDLQRYYEISSIKSENAKLELEGKNNELFYYYIIIPVLGVLFVGVIVLLIVFWRLYRKSRKLAASLDERARAIAVERDTLKRTKRALMNANEQVREAERTKVEFINNVSHEISIPLKAIVEYSRLIVDCIDDEQRGYLENFYNIVKLNTDMVQTLVSDVLDITSIDNSTMHVEIKPTSVNDICNNAIDSIRLQLKPGVEIKYPKKDFPTAIIATDRHRVTQVLLNLLSNAAKFTEEGSITLDYEIDKEHDTITFSVTDTGIGIPAGKEKEIFERYAKLNKYSQGIGLGLPIARLVAQLLKGNVVVDTTYEGHGARFLFTIPVSDK